MSETKKKKKVTDAVLNRRASVAFGAIAILMGIFLVIYIGVMLLGNPDMISYESIYYMINDFNVAASTAGRDYTTLQYGFSFGQSQQYGEYRNGLVVLNESTLTCFSSSGKRTLYERISMTSPTLRTSELHVAAFEKGGSACGIYNSFACLFTEADLGLAKISNDYKIVDVCLADDGSFAVAMHTGFTHSTILLFNKRGVLSAEYSLSSLVTSVSLRNDGEAIAIASLLPDTEDAMPCGELLVYRTGEKKPDTTQPIRDAIPISTAFTENGDLMCVHTRGLLLCNRADATVRSISFPTDEGLLGAELNEHGCIAYFYGDSPLESHGVKVFDKSAQMVYNVSVKDADAYPYHSYVLSANNLFCCADNGISVIDVKTGDVTRYAHGVSRDEAVLVPLRESGEVFAICGGSQATKYELNKKSEG